VTFTILGEDLTINMASKQSSWNSGGRQAFASHNVSPKEHGIARGRFDFATAAVHGATSSGVALDISESAYKGVALSFSPCVICPTGHVNVALTGTVGAIPAIAWEQDSDLPGSTTYLAGIKPYARLDLAISLGLSWCVFRADININARLVNVGFPVYGRLATTSNFVQCSSSEYEADAFSGNVYVSAYHRDWCWDWSHYANYGLFSWSGASMIEQYAKTCSPANCAPDMCAWTYASGFLPTPAPIHRHHNHHNHHSHHRHHGHSRRRRWRM